MKKFAFALAVIVAFSLCACSFVKSESLPSSVTSDGDGVYYTPLDIDLIYVGESSYELRIGLYGSAMIGAKHGDLIALGEQIGDKIGKKVNYLDYKFFTSVKEDISYSENGSDSSIIKTDKTVYYYSYAVNGVTDFELKSRQFGFFDYRYRYNIVSDDFVSQVFPAVVSVVKQATKKFGGYTVDDAATSAEFGLCTTAELSAENAKWVGKRLQYTNYNDCDCFVYQINVGDDVSVLEAEIHVPMASGWYIVPIALGLIAVAIVIIVTKNKRPKMTEQIFRVDSSEQGEDTNE